MTHGPTTPSPTRPARLSPAGPLVLVPALALALSLVGCRRDCEPEPDSELDYADEASWLCHPDLADDSCSRVPQTVEVTPAGEVVPVDFEVAEDPAIDCFYVYPTVDLRLNTALHEDNDDRARQEQAVEAQFARFAGVCRTFAPLYRQVTIGTYVAEDPTRNRDCFDVAYSDVERAFDQFLADESGDRDFVLVGHSQGGQVVSRLLRERVDADADLQDRLLLAMPIGWPVATDLGGSLDGSSSTVPVCTAGDERGCLLSYASFPADEDVDPPSPAYLEGERGVCTHPGDVAGGGPAPLAAAFLKVDGAGAYLTLPEDVPETAEYVVYRDFFEATCDDARPRPTLRVRSAPGEGDLREPPLDLGAGLLTTNNGLHVLDMQLGLGDLLDRVEAAAAANR